MNIKKLSYWKKTFQESRWDFLNFPLGDKKNLVKRLVLNKFVVLVGVMVLMISMMGLSVSGYVCSDIPCPDDCLDQCDGEGDKWWYYNEGICDPEWCQAGTYCRYNARECADDNTMDTVPEGPCNAECDEDSDCVDTDCSYLNICYYDDGDYRYYECDNLENECTNDCVCTENSCAEAYPDPKVYCPHVGTDSDGDGYDNECETCDDEPELYEPEGPTETDCFDGIDNDCDGLTDCADTEDCEGESIICDDEGPCEGTRTCVDGYLTPCSSYGEWCDTLQCPSSCDIDDFHPTYDYAEAQPKFCDEDGVCNGAKCEYIHICADNDADDRIPSQAKATCGAECDEDEDCGDYCSDSVRYYDGICDTADPDPSCACSYDSEDCDDYDCTTPSPYSCVQVDDDTLKETGDDYSCGIDMGGNSVCEVIGTMDCAGPYECNTGNECNTQACGGTTYKCYHTSTIAGFQWLTTPPPEICDDGIDNDCDGDTDCEDGDCAGEEGPEGVICCQEDIHCPSDACTDTGDEYGGGTCSATDNYCDIDNTCKHTDSSGTDSCSGDDEPSVTYYYCSDEDGNLDGADTCLSGITTESDYCFKDGTFCDAEDWYCDGNKLVRDYSEGTDDCTGDSIDPYYECSANDGTVEDTCSESIIPIDCNQYDDDYWVYDVCDPIIGDIFKWYQDWTCDLGECGYSFSDWQDGLAEGCVDECSDTDGGIDYELKGTCTDEDLCTDAETECPVTEHTDSCGLGEVLTEYYCDIDDCASETKDCDDYDCPLGSLTCEGVGTDSIEEVGDDYSCGDGACGNVGTKTCNGPWICDDLSECSQQDCVGTTYICYMSNAGSFTWDTSAEPTETNCGDSYDNDCDGLVDCEDPDCDSTPPETIKEYGDLFVNLEGVHYINSLTPINLDAVDYGDTEDCNAGVDVIYWRNTIVDDKYCSRESPCSEATGEGDFNEYVEPFYKKEESCHLIEYYAVDALGNEEEIKRQCVFVDNTPPVGTKEVGDLKVEIYDECGNGRGWSEPGTGYMCTTVDCCGWYQTAHIHDLHQVLPSGDVYMEYIPGNYDGCPDTATFYYSTDRTIWTEFYSIATTSVDECPGDPQCWERYSTTQNIPESFRYIKIEIPTCYNDYSNAEYLEGYYINQNTPIYLDCEDRGDHPVDQEKVCYKVSFDYPEWMYITEDYCGVTLDEDDWCCVEDEVTIVFEEDSLHDLEYYCVDALGNANEIDIEYFKVDSTPPVTTKIVGEPPLGEDYWITTQTPITLEAQDGGEICAVGVDETYYRVYLCDYTILHDVSLYGEEDPFASDHYKTTIYQTPVSNLDDLNEITYNFKIVQRDGGVSNDLAPYIVLKSLAFPYGVAVQLIPFPTGETFDVGVNYEITVDDSTYFHIPGDSNCGQGLGLSSCTLAHVKSYYPGAVLDSIRISTGAWPGDTSLRIALYTKITEINDIPAVLDEIGAWNIYSEPFTIPEECCHMIEYYSVDLLGNEGGINVQEHDVDDTPPEAEITEPEDGTHIKETVDIIGTATDNKCFDNYVVKADSTVIGSGDEPVDGVLTTWDTTQVEDGVYTVIITATDCAGNEGVSQVEYVVDNTPPTIENPYNNPEYPFPHSSVDVGADVSDEGDETEGPCETQVKLYYRVNEGDWQDEDMNCADSPYIYTFADGFNDGDTVEYYITAEDMIGNTAQSGSEEEPYSFYVGYHYEIGLIEGWNLIGFPVTPDDNAIEEVFSDVNVDTVWAYYASSEPSWHVYHSDPLIPSDLETIETGYGYWANAQEGDTVEGTGSLILAGNNTPPERTLTPGWQLIGYYGTEMYSSPDEFEGEWVPCALHSLINNEGLQPRWSKIYGYNREGKEFYSVSIFGDLDPYDGYWILMSNEQSDYIYGPGLYGGECEDYYEYYWMLREGP